jgi:curved DNA-binding protein CbpA
MSDETHYTVLGISEAATQDEIDRRYRNLIEAYHVLSDSTQRSSYDQQLAQHRQQNAAARPPQPPPKGATTSLAKAVHGLLPGYTSPPNLRPQPQSGEPPRSYHGWDYNPLSVMTAILILIGLWYTVFVIAAKVL